MRVFVCAHVTKFAATPCFWRQSGVFVVEGTLAMSDTINASPTVTGGLRSQRWLFTARSAHIVTVATNK